MRHKVSGRWRLGLTLALITAGFWSTLPLALKIALQEIDPYTLTWIRFLFAFLVTGTWLVFRSETKAFRVLSQRSWVGLMIAALMLIGNYLFYILGLHYTSPTNAQLLIQLAPLLLALGGIVVFREHCNMGQWLGFAAIVTGLALFFSDQLSMHATASRNYLLGSSLVALGAVAWAIYALLQKQLLNDLSSTQIMGFIYAIATLALLPLAHPSTLLRLDVTHALAVLYCALNTLGAYSAFAEALAHWEASRVSVVLALTPPLCAGVVALAHLLIPGLVAAEPVHLLGWIGTAIVVLGSALAALLKGSTFANQTAEDYKN